MSDHFKNPLLEMGVQSLRTFLAREPFAEMALREVLSKQRYSILPEGSLLPRDENASADQLRRARRELGLNQCQVANATGVSQPTICRVENGLRTDKGQKLRRFYEGRGLLFLRDGSLGRPCIEVARAPFLVKRDIS